jgi:hypothetical protein
MIENMIEGRPFLHQALSDVVYHVSENGVEEVWPWSSDKDETIVAFVDGEAHLRT